MSSVITYAFRNVGDIVIPFVVIVFIRFDLIDDFLCCRDIWTDHVNNAEIFEKLYCNIEIVLKHCH